jgi:hypothetical protein
MTKRAWLGLIFQNRKSILKLLRNGIAKYREARDQQTEKVTTPAINELNASLQWHEEGANK